MNKVHHNKRHTLRGWIATVSYPGLKPMIFGTMATAATDHAEVKAQFVDWLAKMLPPGYEVQRVERGRVDVVRESE